MLFWNLGILYQLKKDFENSIQNFKKAVEISSDYSSLYFDFGNTYFANNDYDNAIKCYEKQ